MIKGINRHMIEVTDINSKYYDRAFFLIKPKYEYLQKSILEKEAHSIAKGMGNPTAMNRTHRLRSILFRVVPAVMFGALLTFFVMKICYWL